MRWFAALAAPALLALGPAASAQVLITEVQANPTSNQDDGEWVEIHNIGTASVSIAGWTLTDYAGAESTTRWTFPPGTSLAPGEVIVVAKFANPGYADNTPANLYTRPPTFELGEIGQDDLTVPNLIPIGGLTVLNLANASDGVLLRNIAGDLVSGVEWGGTDRAEIPGMPVVAAGSAESLRRVANTGSSDVDFVVAATPDPFTGFNPAAPSPPMIIGSNTIPRHIPFGVPVTVTATIVDPDGISEAAAFATIATSSVGPAEGTYSIIPLTASGDFYSATGTPPIMEEPATFHDAYARFYIQAEDTFGAVATDPPGATPLAGNTEFYWRNILPAGTSSISEVREQQNNLPIWRFHSARVQGIALTRRTAFVANRTDFFIMSETSSDAIRVFSEEVIPEDVMPGAVVRVTGMIDTFNGLRQIGTPEVMVEIVGTATVPAPAVLTIAEILANAEERESQLVRINDVRFVTPVPTWPSNGNVEIEDGTGMIDVRISAIVDLANMPAPQDAFDIIGILSQFSSNGAGGYQILPRSAGDVIGQTPPVDGGVVDGGGDDAGGDMDSGMLADVGVPGNDAAVAADATTGGQDGSTSGPDAGTGGRDEDEGCDCSTSPAGDHSSGGALAFLLLGLGLWIRRRR